MRYIDSLTIRGIRASIRPGGKLRLEPSWLIDGEVRDVIRNHREEIVNEVKRLAGSADSSGEIAPNYNILMVATDLSSWVADDPRYGYENGADPIYRMLDAPYYAWLRHRMENVQAAHKAGRVDDRTFNKSREQFNSIHDWAIEHIGADALRAAIKGTDVKDYAPPVSRPLNEAQRTYVARALNCPKCGTSNNVKPTEFANISSYKCACGYDCAMDNILLRMDSDKIFAHTEHEEPKPVPETLPF